MEGKRSTYANDMPIIGTFSQRRAITSHESQLHLYSLVSNVKYLNQLQKKIRIVNGNKIICQNKFYDSAIYCCYCFA